MFPCVEFNSVAVATNSFSAASDKDLSLRWCQLHDNIQTLQVQSFCLSFIHADFRDNGYHQPTALTMGRPEFSPKGLYFDCMRSLVFHLHF